MLRLREENSDSWASCKDGSAVCDPDGEAIREIRSCGPDAYTGRREEDAIGEAMVQGRCWQVRNSGRREEV